MAEMITATSRKTLACSMSTSKQRSKTRDPSARVHHAPRVFSSATTMLSDASESRFKRLSWPIWTRQLAVAIFGSAFQESRCIATVLGSICDVWVQGEKECGSRMSFKQDCESIAAAGAIGSVNLSSVHHASHNGTFLPQIACTKCLRKQVSHLYKLLLRILFCCCVLANTNLSRPVE